MTKCLFSKSKIVRRNKKENIHFEIEGLLCEYIVMVNKAYNNTYNEVLTGLDLNWIF